MSRIIVKNIPSQFQQKNIKEHFSQIGSITDCRIIRSSNGKSRRFCFIGFKDSHSAAKAKKQYNQTFLGVSKISIDLATTKNQEEVDQKKSSNSKEAQQLQKNQKQQKFNQFKAIIQEGVKKSWDDVLVAEGNTQTQKKTKKDMKKDKILTKINEQAERKQKITMKPQRQNNIAKPIKVPVLSQKNKKFIQKPLGIDESRLYITNIPYNLTESQLRSYFSKYGTITKIKLPQQSEGINKGFAFITYSIPQQALRAFSKLDNSIAFGRIIHVKPSLQDIGSIITTKKQIQYQKQITQKYGNIEQQKSSFKKRKKRQMRQKLNDTTSWNTLFLNPNTILERVSSKLGISKSQILMSENLAPKVTLAQTQVVNQTKNWMKNVGINLDFLKYDRNACQRSSNIILIKNLNYRTVQSDLKQLFNFYGIIKRFLLAPNRAIGLVEYQNESYAKNAFEKLQNHKFKNNFLFLQYAPIGMLTQQNLQREIQNQQKQQADRQQLSKIVYVKNLNFNTDEHTISQILNKNENIKNQIKSIKIVKTKEGKSMGYGFIEFSSPKFAQLTIKLYQNHILDGHKLILSMSHKKKENLQKAQQIKQKLKIQQIPNHKLIVRNVAFQATKNDLKELFSQFGNVTKIRIPKKINGQHRGFAFIEYQSLEEAGLAKQALENSHLYGRRLVIQYENQSKN